MLNQKGNWKYYFSRALNMKYAVNNQTGELMTEDKALYTKDEIDILSGSQITPELHILKKIFNGKVVKEVEN